MITLGGKLALGVVLAAELRRLRSALVPGLLDDRWDVRVGEELRTQVEQLTDEPSGTIVNLRLHDELQGFQDGVSAASHPCSAPTTTWSGARASLREPHTRSSVKVCGSSRVAAGELVVYGPKVDHDDHYVLGVGGASRKQPARERSSAARM